MPGDGLHLNIIIIFAVGFAFASLMGYIAHRLKLSPMLGYLLAGYLIGPYSPGIVADMALAEELAEIGVGLMLFGVGLHFSLKDLWNVKHIAIPGALGQTACVVVIIAACAFVFGWTIEAGIVFGLGIGVASTVVLVRILADHKLNSTRSGHIAIGWLVVEDIITIIALLVLPVLAASSKGGAFSLPDLGYSIGLALGKFIVLVVLMATLGRVVFKFVLDRVMATESSELFSLTIIALTFIVALLSARVFGTSLALGAFLAGMIIGQAGERKHIEASANPLKETFAVIFFLSIGMLFNPLAIANDLVLFLVVLFVIILVKPAVAFLITTLLREPFKTKVIVSLALAQIGEFSFILAEEATRLRVFPDAGYDVIVAAAFVSIAINPALAKWATSRA